MFSNICQWRATGEQGHFLCLLILQRCNKGLFICKYVDSLKFNFPLDVNRIENVIFFLSFYTLQICRVTVGSIKAF